MADKTAVWTEIDKVLGNLAHISIKYIWYGLLFLFLINCDSKSGHFGRRAELFSLFSRFLSYICRHLAIGQILEKSQTSSNWITCCLSFMDVDFVPIFFIGWPHLFTKPDWILALPKFSNIFFTSKVKGKLLQVELFPNFKLFFFDQTIPLIGNVDLASFATRILVILGDSLFLLASSSSNFLLLTYFIPWWLSFFGSVFCFVLPEFTAFLSLNCFQIWWLLILLKLLHYML